jgi:hypothetical protein
MGQQADDTESKNWTSLDQPIWEQKAFFGLAVKLDNAINLYHFHTQWVFASNQTAASRPVLDPSYPRTADLAGLNYNRACHLP